MSGPSPFATLWAMYALATGTLSVGLDSAGYEVLSRITLLLACGAWLVSVADVLRRTTWRTETPAAVTTLAATAVLGTGFSAAGRQALAEALLAVSALLWATLLVVEDKERGGPAFLRCVVTQGLAVLAATLAAAVSAAWLAQAALVVFWLGLLLCGLALPRSDPRQMARGAGDHWLACGALAVSALAGAKLLSADSARLYLWNDENRSVLRTTAVTLLVLTLTCCVALLVAELVWPRHRYDVRRWATVFGAAASAAATLAVAAALDVPWLDGLGEALLWIAVAAWLGCAAWTVTSARAGEEPGGVRSRARR
ncbi:hypothetical protein [Streptomyces venetus]|uniref:SLAC1 family transporter n=1 Tax=Streptomyces venetus TaxID=1701086 RepID=UPI003C30BF2C